MVVNNLGNHILWTIVISLCGMMWNDPQRVGSSWLVRSCSIGLTTFFYTIVNLYHMSILYIHVHIYVYCKTTTMDHIPEFKSWQYPHLPCRFIQYINIVYMIIHRILPFQNNTQGSWFRAPFPAGKWIKMAITKPRSVHCIPIESNWIISGMLRLLENMLVFEVHTAVLQPPLNAGYAAATGFG